MLVQYKVVIIAVENSPQMILENAVKLRIFGWINIWYWVCRSNCSGNGANG